MIFGQTHARGDKQNAVEYFVDTIFESNKLEEELTAIEKYKLAMTPPAMGSLAVKLGIDKTRHTVERHKLYCYGYVKDKDGNIIQTKENAVKLDENANPIEEEKVKDIRPWSLEQGFAFDKSISDFILALPIEEQTKIFKDLNDIYKHTVIPILENDILYTKQIDNAGNKIYQYGEGVLANMHIQIENRAHPKPIQHLHIHFLAYGFTQRKDESWVATSTDRYREIRAKCASALQISCMKLLQDKYGLELEYVKVEEDIKNKFLKTDEQKNMASFKIKNFNKDLLKATSTRHQDIMNDVKKIADKNNKSFDEVVANSKLVNTLQHNNKASKTTLTTEEVLEGFKETYEQFGFNHEKAKELQSFKQKNIFDNSKIPSEEQLLDNFYRTLKRVKYNKKTDTKERDIGFSEAEFVNFIAKNVALYMPEKEAYKKAQDMFERNCEAHIRKTEREDYNKFFTNEFDLKDSEKIEHIQASLFHTKRYLTKEQKKWDLDTMKMFKDRANENHLNITKNDIDRAILKLQDEKKIYLSEDQINAAYMLDKKGGLMNIVGAAGAGKTTLLQIVKIICDEKNIDLYCTAPSSSAAQVLGNTIGAKKNTCFNTDEWISKLESGKVKISENSIFICDEFSMESSKNNYRFFNLLPKTTRCLLSGEGIQYNAVSGGGLQHEFTQQFEHVTAKLDNIRRQKDDRLVNIVQLIRHNEADKAFSQMWDMGLVTVTNTKDEAYQVIAERFSTFPKGKAYCLTELNKDVEEANIAIRKVQGKGGFHIKCDDGITRPMLVGEEVMITNNHSTVNMKGKKVRAINKTKAVIHDFEINEETQKIENIIVNLKDEDNPHAVNLIKIKNTDETHLKYSQSITGNSSQGETQDHIIMMPNKFTNLNAFYVMNSRHRYSCEMVIYRELVDDLIKYVDHICPATELQQKWVKQISEDKHLNINQDDLKSYSYCHTFLNNHFAKRGLDEMSFKDEQLSLEKKMVMRDFKEVIETWKIAQRNLTTFDYKELDQALDKKLRAFEKERAQAIINKHIAVKEDVLANVIKEYNEDKQLTLDTIEKAPNIKPKETLTPKPIKVKKDTKAKVKEDKPKEAIVDPRQMQFNFDSMENKLTITPQNEDLYKAYGGLDNTQKQQLELDLRLAEELKKEDDSQKLKNVILKDKAKMSKNQNTENTVNQAKNKIAKKTKKVNDENTLKEERIKKQKEKNKAHFEQFNLNIDVNKEEIKKKIKK